MDNDQADWPVCDISDCPGFGTAHPPLDNPKWLDDSIQFPRLIDECAAVLTEDQYERMCASMDLEMDDLMSLFDRAQATWDRIKDES